MKSALFYLLFGALTCGLFVFAAWLLAMVETRALQHFTALIVGLAAVAAWVFVVHELQDILRPQRRESDRGGS